MPAKEGAAAEVPYVYAPGLAQGGGAGRRGMGDRQESEVGQHHARLDVESARLLLPPCGHFLGNGPGDALELTIVP